MKLERLVYVATAVVALVWTQSLVIQMTRDGASLSASWGALTANATTQFATIDLLAVFVAATTFMIVEGRRLRLKVWWLYPLLGVTVAISVAFPLFLLARSFRKG